MHNRFNDDSDDSDDSDDDLDDDTLDDFLDNIPPPIVAIRTSKLGAASAFADLFDVANALVMYLGQDEDVQEFRTFLLNLAMNTLKDEETGDGGD